MVEMIWKEPPPAVSAEKAAILTELRNHPGRWALVQQDRSSSSAAAPWQKLGCESKAARKNPGEAPAKYDVYARWPEAKRTAAKEFSAGGVNPVAPRPAVGGGTYDPGAGRAARGIPADGLPVESLRK